jgi:hypothetical protein
VIPVSMVVYWMMIFWLKESDTCVNGDLLNDEILIKTKWFLTNVSIVVYWMTIFWLKQSDTWKLKQSDTCVNSGLLNDDTLVKTKWYLKIKTKWYLTNVSIVVYWMMIFWLKQSDTWKLKQSDTWQMCQ